MIPRRKLPPLNALRAFEVAGRRLNFRLAAEELAVTQGAVAQQVRALEDHLGQPLFQRLSRGLALTPSGTALLAEVSGAFDLLAQAVERLAPSPEKVTISVTPTVASRLLIPRLADLEAALPGVELRTIAEERRTDFDRDPVDIAIGLGPVPPGVEALLLLRQEVIAVAAPSLAQGPLTDAQILALPLLHHCFDHWPRFLGRGALPGPRFSLTTLAIDAALAGRGAAAVARAFVAHDLAVGRLVQISPRSLLATPDYYMTRRPTPQPRPAAQAVWDWCRTHLTP